MRRELARSGAAMSCARLVVFPALFALGACDTPSQAQETSAPEVVRVRAVDVVRAPRAPRIHAVGIVADESARTLSFAVAGVVADVRVDEGDTVRRGQVLARLELDTVDAQTTQASAALERAERDLARVESLAGSGAIASQVVDDARTAARVSRADVRSASFARRHAVIVAPDDGVVLRRTVEPGETVASGQPALAVSLTREGRIVRVSVTDRDVVRLREGDGATITLDALPERAIRARISRIPAAADPSTGLHAVELESAELGTLGARVVAGLVARATLEPVDVTEVALVPPTALVEADERDAFVWALSADGRRATRKRVRIGFIDGELIAIREGLEGVSRVVTEGAAYVRTASRLEVVANTAQRGAP